MNLRSRGREAGQRDGIARTRCEAPLGEGRGRMEVGLEAQPDEDPRGIGIDNPVPVDGAEIGVLRGQKIGCGLAADRRRHAIIRFAAPARLHMIRHRDAGIHLAGLGGKGGRDLPCARQGKHKQSDEASFQKADPHGGHMVDADSIINGPPSIRPDRVRSFEPRRLRSRRLAAAIL
jgi:hypothetical protein